MRIRYFIVLTALLCVSSSISTLNTHADTYNFTLRYMTSDSVGSLIVESGLKDMLKPLGIELEKVEYNNYKEYLSNILSHNYDMLILDPVQSEFDFNMYDSNEFPFYPTLNRYRSDGNSILPIGNATTSPLINGYSRAKLDRYISDLNSNNYPLRLKGYIDSFQYLYFTQVLYDFPLGKLPAIQYMQLGYGLNNPSAICHCKTDMWNLKDGPLNSRKLGASWDNTITNSRLSNETTFNMPVPAYSIESTKRYYLNPIYLLSKDSRNTLPDHNILELFSSTFGT